MKNFILLPALIILLIPLFSCSGGDDSVGSVGSVGSAGSAGDTDAVVSDVPPDTAESSKLEPDLPDADFDGAVVNFLVRGEEHHWYWCSNEIYAEHETGEPLNDAVYRRNRYVEDKHNFVISERRSANPHGDALRAAQSGDDAYDVFMASLNEGASLAQSGFLVDLHEAPHINLSQPWWDRRAVNQLNIGGRLYSGVSDITTQDNDSIFVIFFNQQLIIDHQMDDPYRLVRDGEWTLDKFNEMAAGISADINGDGVMGPEDLFGQLGEYLGAYMLFAGAGGRIASNNFENYPELVLNNEKTPAIIDKVLVNMGDRNVSLMANDYSGRYGNPWDELTRPMFKNNQGLFYTIGMGTGNLLRDMEIDFGVLPLPKSDANQSEYYCPVTTSTAVAVCIPAANPRLEFTGFAIEAMAAESMYTVTEAYYSINFENKSLRDEESIEMLRVILNSCSYDLGYMFNFGGLVDIFEPMARNNSNTFASDYERRENNARQAIEKLIESFAEND